MRLYIHAFVHAFAMFLRVSKMLYGTASGDEFAVSQTYLMDAFISHVHLPCAYVQLSACAYYMHAFALCFRFRRCCTAPPLGMNLAHLRLEFCWASAVSQACLTDAFIGHVQVSCGYVQLSAMRLLLLCVYGFRRCCTAPPLRIW